MSGKPLGTSQTVLLNASYCKKHKYIWFKGGDLNIQEFKNCFSLGMPVGQPLGLKFSISNFLAKLYINIYHIRKNQNNPSSG